MDGRVAALLPAHEGSPGQRNFSCFMTVWSHGILLWAFVFRDEARACYVCVETRRSPTDRAQATSSLYRAPLLDVHPFYTVAFSLSFHFNKGYRD